jgi:hypothetical protein
MFLLFSLNDEHTLYPVLDLWTLTTILPWVKGEILSGEPVIIGKKNIIPGRRNTQSLTINSVILFFKPLKAIFASLGVWILQQLHTLTEEESVSPFSFNLQWHYALDIPGESDESKYLCAKALGARGR